MNIAGIYKYVTGRFNPRHSPRRGREKILDARPNFIAHLAKSAQNFFVVALRKRRIGERPVISFHPCIQGRTLLLGVAAKSNDLID